MILRIRKFAISPHRLKSTCLDWPLSVGQNARIRFSQHLKEIEAHWSKKPNNCSRSSNQQKYILAMFPYPSGNLHMGHMRVYTLSDVLARYYRLNGYEVIHPIGWDAFGLPAENAARERGIDSREWTESNIASMRQQLLATGVDFDWDREIRTCDPDYYKWNQWIFLKLYEKGLAKRALSEVNWDPVDGTVLADEQIDAEGRSWRSGALAEKRTLRQWVIETPRYVERLMKGLQTLAPQWDDVALLQANWIGPCDVYRFLFPLKNTDNQAQREERLDLRLKDPLKLGNAPFVMISPEHALAKGQKNIGGPSKLPIEVLNGVTGCYLPLFVVPDKLLHLGPHFMNARLACPEIDKEWLQTFNLPRHPPRKTMSMNLNDVFELAQFGGYAGYLTSRVQRDWVVSRQRAWGTPIPMVLSKDGLHAAPLSFEQLPVLQGSSNKSTIEHLGLPGGQGMLESDTLDTFFDSSWYYLRFLDPHNPNKLVDYEKAKKAMPVDVYVGGIEHAALHMYYARFMCHFLYDIGISPVEEPFHELIPQGIVKAKTFFIKNSGKYVNQSDVEKQDSNLIHRPTGEIVEMRFEKMSKSKHNGIDPMEALLRDGKDLTRLQLLYAAAPRSVIDWGEFDSRGLTKWLDRVSRIVSNYIEGRTKVAASPNGSSDEKLRAIYNTVVKKVTWNLEELQLHRQALCDLMTLTNQINDIPPEVFSSSEEAERTLRALLIMMQIFAPHATQEFWEAVQSVQPINALANRELLSQSWPETDPDAQIDFFLKMHGEKFDTTYHPRYDIESLDMKSAFGMKKDFLQSDPSWNLTNLKELETLGHRVYPVGNRIRKGIFYELSVDVEPRMPRDVFQEMVKKVGHRRDEAQRGKRKMKKKAQG
ncbi:unnamed protein product, partial [Mesorhabditis belari]|uniref:leucine--tRNA ligase n=1 Tax=Mesorhabditis belari TaxID=2138241 RepID=A0AAF3FGY2_9BILA